MYMGGVEALASGLSSLLLIDDGREGDSQKYRWDKTFLSQGQPSCCPKAADPSLLCHAKSCGVDPILCAQARSL